MIFGRLTYFSMIVILIANFAFAAGAARMPTGAALPPLPQGRSSQVNWLDIQMLQAKKMKSYATSNRDAALKADVARILKEAERLGVFPDVPGFRDWLEINSARISSAQMTRLIQDASVTQFTTAMYVSYTAEIGFKMDRNAAMIAKAIPVAASAGGFLAAKAAQLLFLVFTVGSKRIVTEFNECSKSTDLITTFRLALMNADFRSGGGRGPPTFRQCAIPWTPRCATLGQPALSRAWTIKLR